MKHFFMLGLALAFLLPYQAFFQKHSNPTPVVAAKVAPGGGGGPSASARADHGTQASDRNSSRAKEDGFRSME